MADNNNTIGRYLLTEFYISIMGDGILNDLNDISNWTIEQKYVFLHEYVHYFQNIYTYYGLNLFSLIIDNSWSFYGTLGKEINVPLKQSPSEFYEELMILFRTRGEKTDVKKLVSYRIVNVNNLYKVVKARCINYDDEEVEIKFGSCHIDEGMASLIQETVYPETNRKSSYNPYYLATELADLIIPGISENKFAMVALFDYALHFDNPAYYFVKYLEKKKKEGYNRVSLTCDRIYNDIGYWPNKHVMTVDALLRQVDEIFEYSESAVRTRHWFRTIIKRSMIIRMKRPRIFVDLMQGGDISDNETFKYLLTELGTPIVENENKDYSFYCPHDTNVTTDDLISFYALLQINKVFYSKGRFCCPLTDYCKSKLSSCVDERCETHPWMLPKRLRRCFFSECWERLGLKDVRIIGEES